MFAATNCDFARPRQSSAAGNEEMVNNHRFFMAAITDTGKVEILCREHITSKESFL